MDDAEHKFLRVLQKIAKNNGLIDHQIKCKSIKTSGFTSHVCEATILSKNKKLFLIIKHCGANNAVRSVMPIKSFFKRETYMYEIIFPLLRQFEIERGINPSEHAPKYYSSHNGNTLVLDNLKEIGYMNDNRHGLFDHDHVQLVIKQYAKMHAASLGCRDQNDLQFKAAVESMDDFIGPMYRECALVDLFTKHMKKAGTSLDPGMHKTIKNVYDKSISEIKHFVELLSAVDDYSVIIHGDCRKNNIMFKYDDQNNPTTPTDVRLIDYQTSRLASPMIDIANFLYTCSSKDVIDNIPKYLNMYYDNLSHCLQDLGSDPEKVYPFSVMMQHWRTFAFYGLLTRITALAVLFSEDKECKRISDIIESGGNMSNMLDYEISDIEEYNNFSRHTIMHFVENQLI